MLRSYALTDIGQKRQLNQDFIYLSEGPIGNLPNVFIVADGMGGHKAGDYASDLAVETVIAEVETSFEKNPEKILNHAISRANEILRKRASEDYSLSGMGTTFVAAACLGRFLEVANVGDSRLYVIGEKIEQITEDHSLVEEMVQSGKLHKEDMRTHPNKNIITRALGTNSDVKADCFEIEVDEGDVLLLCSDGLSNMLEDEKIERIIRSNREDMSEAGRQLVQEANEAGGKDNISVVLIQV